MKSKVHMAHRVALPGYHYLGPLCSKREPRRWRYVVFNKKLVTCAACRKAMKAVVALLLLVASGCQTVVLHDTVYNDYLGTNGWTTIERAERMPEWRARSWAWRHRVFELGEYANNGAAGYPIEIMEVK